MQTVSYLSGLLPAFQGDRDVKKNRQSIKDIVKEVLEAHKFFAGDYDEISEEFAGGDTLKQLFDFCKSNIAYQIEPEDDQTTRSPAAIMWLGKFGGDCKHYASFIGGVLDSLNRKGLANFDWCYRFASYNFFNRNAGHVFIVVKTPDGEIWVDPVLDKFDSRSPYPVFIKDKKISGMLSRLSGVEIATSHNIVARKDLRRQNEMASCGCACNENASVSGVDIVQIIKDNPIEAGIGAIAIGYLIYKLVK